MSLTCGVTPFMILTARSIIVVDGRKNEMARINIASDGDILNGLSHFLLQRAFWLHSQKRTAKFFHHGLNLAQNLNRVWFGTDSRLE